MPNAQYCASHEISAYQAQWAISGKFKVDVFYDFFPIVQTITITKASDININLIKGIYDKGTGNLMYSF